MSRYPDIDAAVEHLSRCTRQEPWPTRRRQHLTGLPMWVEDFDLDLEYHVRYSALPYPGRERELGVLVSRLHSNPMYFNRPLWEYHIIEGLERNRFAVHFKMHHALVDGVAGVRMLQRSMSTRQDDVDAPALWSASQEDGDTSPTSSAVERDVLHSLGSAARSAGAVAGAMLRQELRQHLARR